MEQNDLDSFTIGLIKRTQERNKFLEEMNLTLESIDTETEETKVCDPYVSPFKDRPEEKNQIVKKLLKPVVVGEKLPKLFPLKVNEEIKEVTSTKNDQNQWNKRENHDSSLVPPKKKESLKNVSDKSVSRTFKSGKIDENDPCLLPLAARRAIFEKKMAVGNHKEIEPSQISDKIVTSTVLKSSDVDEALAAFKEIDELPSDDNNCNENYEIFEAQPVLIEDESNDSLGSNASSLLSSNDESVAVISQSTKIYPELPPLHDLVHDPCQQRGENSPYTIISPIKKIDCPTSSEPPTLRKVDQYEKRDTQPSTPFRTLSMYRKEQKVLSTLKRLEDDGDEIITDLEINAFKRDLLKKYNESKSRKIDELKVEADKYNKIIYQSFRALDLCVQTNNVSERIEAEKILLINMVKKNACVDELYRLQKEESIDVTDEPVGKVAFNKLTLLVKGDFFVSQANGYDLYDYHFMCLFTCADKVVATDALSSTDAIQEASLKFANTVVFNNLRKDFRIRLDVYALALPKGKRNTDKVGAMSLRLTPKSKTKVKYTHSPALKASPNSENIKCNFKLIGNVTFTRNNIMKSRFELLHYMYSSPIEDQIMVGLSISGEYNLKYSSYLNFHEKSGDFPVWNRRWCVLVGPLIYYWRFSEDEGDKQPLGVICLKQCVNPVITKATADICMRANSFSFVTLEKQENALTPVKHLMAADIRKERDTWLEKLNKALEMIRLWEQDALLPMDQASLNRIWK